MKLSALAGVLVGGCLLSGVAPARAADRCYMAFLHGSGENLHDEAPDSPALAGYWAPNGNAALSFTRYAARPWAEEGCVSTTIGYDGNQAWWSERAAGRVAAALHDFIEAHAIPDGRLVLVTHSMGGVVARYLVNNGTPHAPYYNEYHWLDGRMDYDLVRRKTGQIISVQAPHTGAQAADALYGDADNTLSNTAASVIRLFNFRERTPATDTLTRGYLEAAGAPGGEMGDEGRQVVIYTVAGQDSGDASGLGSDLDDDLDLAWILLCYKKGARNSWGAACQWDFWNFRGTLGDGLVERASSHGRWLRGKVAGQASAAGAWSTWLDVVHNHNQGRFDALVAAITDYRRGVKVNDYLGSYVGWQRPPLP